MSIEIFKDLKDLEKAYTGFHKTKTYSIGTVYVESEQLAVTLYENALIVRTLDNALKRGKTVIKHTAYFQKGSFDGREIMNEYMFFLKINFAELIERAVANDLPDIDDGSVKNLHDEEKAVRVFSPFAKPKKVNPHSKWTMTRSLKRSVGQITQGVQNMALTDDYAYDAAVNFRKVSCLTFWTLPKS
ncbi:hypothetical protein I6G80_24335 (plasmid) [Bacillus licheniformis]|uniref:Uncharacterized protein n=1 Tax=Bacillus licheniformis TaxID=1402 RepID=A0AB37GR28_BACLI|nr:hypothetical protein [Bacillus licheniformis]QPR75140.1 hypothetical protein I6G80_24335 [Bacillus licheniformis]